MLPQSIHIFSMRVFKRNGLKSYFTIDNGNSKDKINRNDSKSSSSRLNRTLQPPLHISVLAPYRLSLNSQQDLVTRK